jgi:hypothetical protein
MALFKRFCACAAALQQREVTSRSPHASISVTAAFIMSGPLFGLIVLIFGLVLRYDPEARAPRARDR